MFGGYGKNIILFYFNPEVYINNLGVIFIKNNNKGGGAVNLNQLEVFPGKIGYFLVQTFQGLGDIPG